MTRIELHALSEVRAEAALLLAERYAAQREREVLLAEMADLEPLLPEDGLVATSDGRAVAFLAGSVEGDTARVGFAGHAASDPEALRDLFRAAAERWDVSRFAVAVPAHDVGLVNVWFRLAFGCQFIWAIRETEPAEPVDFGGVIRPGALDDVDAVIELDALLWELQARAPSFSGLAMPSPAIVRAEWQEVWDEPERFTTFIAERDGRVVGHLLLYRRPAGDLRVPPDNVDLAHASTLEDVRGSGVGLALTAHALNWAHEQGFRSITADWRSVNLLASHFWPRRGFRPQYLRLYRAVP